VINIKNLKRSVEIKCCGYIKERNKRAEKTFCQLLPEKNELIVWNDRLPTTSYQDFGMYMANSENKRSKNPKMGLFEK
jgi:hypothetical protein